MTAAHVAAALVTAAHVAATLLAAAELAAATVTAAATMTTMLAKLGRLCRGSAARARNDTGADGQSGNRADRDHRALDREESHRRFSFFRGLCFPTAARAAG
jgi:hypothetical protein